MNSITNIKHCQSKSSICQDNLRSSQNVNKMFDQTQDAKNKIKNIVDKLNLQKKQFEIDFPEESKLLQSQSQSKEISFDYKQTA